MPKKITEALIKEHQQTLRETLPRIAGCVQRIDEQRLKTPPVRGEWSVVQNLAHIRACAEVWGYSIYAALLIENPELADIHPRNWMKMQGYARLTFAENFQAFDVERRNLLRKLEGLTFDDYARSIRFQGKVNVHTIFSQVQRMALHEAQHCDQIEAMYPSI